MSMMRLLLIALIAPLAWMPAGAATRGYNDDRSVVNREILDALDSLRHSLANHETEIRIFEERFKSQDEIIDTLRQQTADTLKACKGVTSSIETKMATQELSNKGVSQDVGNILADYKKRIGELEKAIEQQNKNLEHLQSALRLLTEALGGKDTSIAAVELSGTKIYRVKAGDSLEKIAKQNHTTIKKLKELNSLTSDQIIVGQKLQLPDEG